MKKTERFKLWLPVIIWAGIIFSFSSMAINKETEFSWLDFIVKKTAHVVEYAILYWLTFRAFSEKGKIIQKKYFLIPFLLCFIYAMSDEWHQTFVAGREGTLRDVGFDTIGALFSWNQIKRNI